MGRRMKILGQLFLFSSVAVALLPACGVSGERALGGCPPDEICSAATPDGLVFEGPDLASVPFSGASIAPVAIGGTQRIAIRVNGRDPLPVFDAESTDSSVAIDGISGNEITIRGVEAGTSLLRVVDPGDGGSLLDRISVAAAPVDRAVTMPTEDLAIMLAPDPRDVRYAPGEHTVAVQLRDPAGRIVVDQGMRVTVADTAATVSSWDAIRLAVPEGGVSVTVDAAGATFSTRLESAGPIDDVELVDWLTELDDAGRPLVSAGEAICAVGLSEGAWVVGVASASRFVLGGVELASDSSSAIATHCARIPAAAEVGIATIEVTLAGATRSFEIQIDAPATSTSAALTASPRDRRSRALGERAASAD